MYYGIILRIFISILGKQIYYYFSKRKYSFEEKGIDIVFTLSLIGMFFYFMFFYLDKVFANDIPYIMKLFYTLILVSYPLIISLLYGMCIKKVVGKKGPYFPIESFIFIFLLPIIVSNIAQMVFNLL